MRWDRWTLVTHLLVKESPEHWQGDVEEEHLDHHLYLGNQKFLQQQAGEIMLFLHVMILKQQQQQKNQVSDKHFTVSAITSLADLFFHPVRSKMGS